MTPPRALASRQGAAAVHSKTHTGSMVGSRAHLAPRRSRMGGGMPLKWLERARRRVRHPLWNLGYRLAGSLDGYPFPPARLINLVINTREIAWYQLGGLFNHQAFTSFM